MAVTTWRFQSHGNTQLEPKGPKCQRVMSSKPVGCVTIGNPSWAALPPKNTFGLGYSLEARSLGRFGNKNQAQETPLASKLGTGLQSWVAFPQKNNHKGLPFARLHFWKDTTHFGAPPFAAICLRIPRRVGCTLCSEPHQEPKYQSNGAPGPCRKHALSNDLSLNRITPKPQKRKETAQLSRLKGVKIRLPLPFLGIPNKKRAAHARVPHGATSTPRPLPPTFYSSELNTRRHAIEHARPQAALAERGIGHGVRLQALQPHLRQERQNTLPLRHFPQKRDLPPSFFFCAKKQFLPAQKESGPPAGQEHAAFD